MPTRRAFTPEQIRSLCRGHSATMVKVLVGIARQPNAAPAARVAAANSILERGFGKALQEVSSKSEVTVVIRKILSGEMVTIEQEPLALPQIVDDDNNSDNQ